MQEKLRLSIDGMHCGACVRRVSAALGKVAGVEVGKVEIGSAELAYDTGLASAEQIAAAVDKIGFTARAAS